MKRILIILLILGMQQVIAQDTTFYRAMQVSFVALNVADYALTINGLSKGAVEQNPVINKYFNDPYRMAGFKLAMTGGILYLTDKIHKRDPKLAKWALVGLNLFYGAVVTNNIKVTLQLNIN